MFEEGPDTCHLDAALYAKSQSQIREFKARLPPASVAGLAREVIRRLAAQGAEISAQRPSEYQLESFFYALISDDDQAGAAFIQQARAAGASIEAIYLTYLAGAARMLGLWWDNDLATFSEVTLGTSRMYAIMRAIRRQIALPTTTASKSAIFTIAPGETHTLGIRMATDLFRKDGWRIDLQIEGDHDALVSHISNAPTQLVGISAGGAHSLQALSRLIVALRINRPDAMIFVSGHIVEEAADAIELIGVDGLASDIHAAKVLMNQLWQTLQP
ncbi:cobalamin B12-binding domain-containing protein [Cognatiyoonia sp. IB215182]|uniref:cobalamin B12-binding domain-containing protein n=1 Tax=Cognatiyoonia sp. IB215182 TaxID=3097353 RepID=UPI002A0BD66A|nr:cobalamin B12-binding domain-containing protein [Cognatiyoonia sp. IB215182]MDX8352171.1 cobalamin B12-binding domain-containing protein [Cognatiyoonia sp. IB215182]